MDMREAMGTRADGSPERAAARTVPPWRAEPYRVLFAEAFALGWAGVLVWILHAAGAVTAYRSEYHALTQVEGFLGCIAVGFLLTFIPRRTGGPPASGAEIALAAVLPVAVAIAAWSGAILVSQVAWLALVALVLAFALR